MHLVETRGITGCFRIIVQLLRQGMGVLCYQVHLWFSSFPLNIIFWGTESKKPSWSYFFFLFWQGIIPAELARTTGFSRERDTREIPNHCNHSLTGRKEKRLNTFWVPSGKTTTSKEEETLWERHLACERLK